MKPRVETLRLKLLYLGLSFSTCKMSTLDQMMVLNFMN